MQHNSSVCCFTLRITPRFSSLLDSVMALSFRYLGFGSVGYWLITLTFCAFERLAKPSSSVSGSKAGVLARGAHGQDRARDCSLILGTRPQFILTSRKTLGSAHAASLPGFNLLCSSCIPTHRSLLARAVSSMLAYSNLFDVNVDFEVQTPWG